MDTQLKLEYETLVKFMGYETNYSLDWNHLMEIVEKIESLPSQRYGGYSVTIFQNKCTIQTWARTKESGYSRTYQTEDSKRKLKAVYESCLLFIEWYNKENPK